MIKGKWLIWIGLAALLAVGAIYQWKKNDAVRSREQLEQRVSEYYEALRVNDFQTIYALESGSVNGSLTPDQAYKGNPTGVRILSYKSEITELDGDFAKVKISTKITFPEINGKEIVGGESSEAWVRIKGSWYHDTPVKPQP